MTEKDSLALEKIRDLIKEAEFERAQDEVVRYLATVPDDADALALQRHLDNLDTLQQINRAIYAQDWDQVIHQVEAAIEMGLTWDIELYSLTEVLKNAKQRRTQAADLRARSLLKQAQEAQEAQDLAQARELYTQAIATPHLSIPLRAQLQSRLDDLRTSARTTMGTIATMKQPDELMKGLIDTILAKSRTQVADAVRLCAIPFWFNLELLSVLRDNDDGLEEKILKRMARFSFVDRDDSGRYTFNEDVRHYLLGAWDKRSADFTEANRRAQSYFMQQVRAMSPSNDLIDALANPGETILPRTLTETSPQVGELLQDYVYHTFAVDGDAGIALLRQLFRAADEAHHLALAQRYLEIADEQRVLLKPAQRDHIDYMRGLLCYAQGQREAGRNLFERMLECEGLDPTLEARVRRALGNILVYEERWDEAVELFESALEGFQAGGDALESALTKIKLGQAYLDLALNIWGGGKTFQLKKGWLDRIQELALFMSNLPIVVYLMSRLGVRAVLPVILHVGREMDWVVARLFVTAAGQFNQADFILQRLNDQAGLERIQENLGWLHLLLGHFRRAETIYRRLLAREDLAMGEYRIARARLGLAEAVVRQGRLVEGREMLEQILPIFAAHRHLERVAQTHTLLAQTFALEDQPAQAVDRYQQAVGFYRQLDDDANVTEVVEQMQLLRDAGPKGLASSREGKDQTTDTFYHSIDTTASQITRRRYLTRFSLPLLDLFRLLALIGLSGVFLLGLFTSISIESGTDLAVDQVLLGSRRSAASPFEPVIEFDLNPRLEPSLGVDFAVYIVVVAVILYLVLYTIFGLWLTTRISLRTLQEEQRLDILADPDGISRGDADLTGGLKIKWGEVAALLSSNRSLFNRPLAIFSRFVLFSERGWITVDGQTRRYLAARDFIRAHLDRPTSEASSTVQSTPTYNFGFSVFHSHSGRLYVGTFIFILAFVILAQIAPQVLMTNLGSLPYSLADLYSISYLGLLIPLGWWLVPPLRERLFLKPHTRRVWLIGIGGLLLAAFTFLDLTWLRLSIGRPSVAPGLFAAFLVGLAAYYVWTTRHWKRIPFQKGDYVYSLVVRLVSGVVALVVVLVVLGLVGREVVAYHYLALANSNRLWAADATQAGDDTHAQELYERALSYYDQALSWVENDADTYHSKGVVLSQLSRYQEAVEAIKEAIDLNSNKTAYYGSLAIAYEMWAQARQEASDDQGSFQYQKLAYENYSSVIQRTKRGSENLKMVYLSRASASSQMGEYYRGEAMQVDAIESYEAAFADYDWVARLEPDNSTALIGLGWMEYRLANYKDNSDEKRTRLQVAVDYFEQAAAADPQQLSVWTGQGYTRFAIGVTFTWWDEGNNRTRTACFESERNPRTPEEAQVYRDENLKAIEAFERAAQLTSDNASFYGVQGGLYFNLIDCPGMDNYETYLAAIERFSQAIRLTPDDLTWRLRRGNLYIVLIDNYDQDYYAEAIADYEVIVSLEPTAQRYWLLGSLYRRHGDLDQAVKNYALAVELNPTSFQWQWSLGWYAYENGDYQLSIEASRAATSLDPTEPRTVFNWGLALVALGDVEEAWRVYRDGVTVASALVNTQTALARYDEALNDLGEVAQDPAGIADALRAHLTFKKALLYVRMGLDAEARSTYQSGITIADTLSDQETRLDLYDETLDDLRNTGTASSSVAELLKLLEAARDR